MKKETARDIAIALVAKSGQCFDSFAFDDCDSISEGEKEKIGKEIQIYCQRQINKIEKKYRIRLKNSTAEIIEGIVFE